MGLLYGRAGRLTALFGGFWPGQVAGRVDISGGVCQYKAQPKLSAGRGLLGAGVQTDAAVPESCKLMLLTSVSYVVIQAPAMWHTKLLPVDGSHGDIKGEKTFALVGFIVAGATARRALRFFQSFRRHFRERELKTPIFSERVAPKTPNASHPSEGGLTAAGRSLAVRAGLRLPGVAGQLGGGGGGGGRPGQETGRNR